MNRKKPLFTNAIYESDLRLYNFFFAFWILLWNNNRKHITVFCFHSPLFRFWLVEWIFGLHFYCYLKQNPFFFYCRQKKAKRKKSYDNNDEAMETTTKKRNKILNPFSQKMFQWRIDREYWPFFHHRSFFWLEKKIKNKKTTKLAGEMKKTKPG